MSNGARAPLKTMGYTTRGKGWEWAQSWFLGAFLTYYLYWAAMLYMGLRVMQLKWVFWGAIYSLPFLAWLTFDPAKHPVIGAYVNRWLFGAYVIALVHALYSRGEFLVRLQSTIEEREELMETARLKAEIAAEQAVPGRGAGAPAAPKPARRRFDINTIEERELAMLPGMGFESAHMAVMLREGLKGFRSFDHFAEKTGINDVSREKLRPFFEEPDAPRPSPLLATDHPAVKDTLDGRRVLELNLADAEAISLLPGLGSETARKAVTLREADGPYKSLEDFRFRVGLSMDVMVKIAPLVSTVRTRKQGADGVKPSGRIVDV
jgi:DNA uptake protein ComE-like DNA-binding protein